MSTPKSGGQKWDGMNPGLKSELRNNYILIKSFNTLKMLKVMSKLGLRFIGNFKINTHLSILQSTRDNKK